MPATADDPEAIESEIEELKARRERLKDRREPVEADLQDARAALQDADADDDALARAERLQGQYDALTEAITDVEVDLEALRSRLSDARAAQREEEKLEALARKGRKAVQAREEYDDLRDEVLAVLREQAPELARLYDEWSAAATAFRDALVRVERHVRHRPTAGTTEDEERAEALVSALKDRGVEPFKDALDPHRGGGKARRWMGWSHENGYSGPGGRLGDAVEAIRQFGNQSDSSNE
jgi:chromosome segregation ATPase